MQWAERFFSKRWTPFLLIGGLTLLVWGHTVRYDFVWDDKQFILELQSIRSLKNVPSMFTSLEAQSSFPEGFKLFRPLRTLHYAVLYQFSGEHAPLPALYHLSNVLWHGGAAMLLYLVALLLFPQLIPGISPDRVQWLALFVAVAFAAHPVVSEVVCWAKSLDDAMAAVFTLASMRALLRRNEDRRNYLWALFWFLLAVYSKISAVPFAVVAFLTFFQVRKLSFRRSATLSAAFFAIALLFMVHRHFVIGQSNQTAPLSGSYGQTLLDMFPVAAPYLRLLCGIPPFCIDYSFMTGHQAIFSGPVLAGFALLLFGAGVAWVAIRKPEYCLAGFGLLWMGAFLVPVSNILPMMQYMAERFLYLPLIGWLFVLALIVHRVPRWQLSAPLCAGALAAWALIASSRSTIWQDNLTLFVQTSQQHPGIARVEQNAVAAIFKLPHVRAVFELDPSGQSLRVMAQPTSEQRQAVQDTLLEAQRLFPHDENIASALGILHAISGQPSEAIPFFKAAVQRRPGNARFWTNLGRASMEANAWTAAQEAITKALTLEPDNVDALRAASRLAWKREDYASAAGLFEKLQRLEPNEPEHLRWLNDARARLKTDRETYSR
jgi:hypothetical protein